MILTREILQESPAARNLELDQITESRIKEIIQKVKPLKFTLWDDIEFITVPQMAYYFGCDTGTLRGKIRQSYCEEFERDKVKCLVDKEQRKAAHSALSQTYNKSKLIICPPKAVLRMAMIISSQNDLAAHVVETWVEENKGLDKLFLPDDKTIAKSLAELSQTVAISESRILEIAQKVLEVLPFGKPTALPQESMSNYTENNSTEGDFNLSFVEQDSVFDRTYVANGNHQIIQ